MDYLIKGHRITGACYADLLRHRQDKITENGAWEADEIGALPPGGGWLAEMWIWTCLTPTLFTWFGTLRLRRPKDEKEAQLSPFWQPWRWCYHCRWPPPQRRDPYALQPLDEACKCRRWLKIKLKKIKCARFSKIVSTFDREFISHPSSVCTRAVLVNFCWPWSEAFDIRVRYSVQQK